MHLTCHACAATFSVEPPLSRRAECPSCGRDAKVCLNCRFYDPQAHHECREPNSEWVREKEVGNFCEYFSPRSSSSSPAQGLSEADLAKEKLSKLFR